MWQNRIGIGEVCVPVFRQKITLIPFSLTKGGNKIWYWRTENKKAQKSFYSPEFHEWKGTTSSFFALVPLFPKKFHVPFFPLVLLPYSVFSSAIFPVFPCFPKTPGRPSNVNLGIKVEPLYKPTPFFKIKKVGLRKYPLCMPIPLLEV